MATMRRVSAILRAGLPDRSAALTVTPRAGTLGSVVKARQESLRATRDRQRAEELLARAGERSSDIAEAIELAESAVGVHRRTGPPEECAASWYVLATAWWARTDGEPEENQERALDAMLFALDLRGQVGPREEWARVLANIGALYWQRAAGHRRDNIELAIGAWQTAADAFDARASNDQAEQWVIATENLATGYLRRRLGGRAENVDAALSAIEAVADLHRDRGRYVEEAQARRWLATALIEHRSDPAGANVEDAVEILAAVLRTSGMPVERVAETEVSLALAYMRRARGDHRQNIEHAMSHCRSALARHPPTDSAAVAQANGTLGAALLVREPQWDPASVEVAIAHLRSAVAMFARTGPRKELAKAQLTLGQALWHRASGDSDDNREEALETWLDAGRTLNEAVIADHEPRDFASDIENAVGSAYLQRRTGDSGDNIEHAIASFWRATHEFHEDSPDDRLAIARHNLGTAYLQRATGDAAQNLTRARDALEAASRVRTRERSPLDWALTQTTLGVAYARLAEIGHDDDLADRAVEAHRAALEVLDPDRDATEWRRAQANLASAYLVRARRGRAGDADKAIEALERVVDATPDRPSVEWLSACQRLGFAYLGRDDGRHGEDGRRAIRLWQACLDGPVEASLADVRRTTARALGDALGERGRWAEAADAYLIAVNATNELYRGSVLASSQSAELESSGDTFARAAYALARDDPGRATEALLVLEHGRARTLAEQLSRDSIEQAAMRCGDPELHRSYAATLASLREIEGVLRDGSAIAWILKLEGAPPDLVDDENGRRVAERLLAWMVSNGKERLEDLARQILSATTDSREPSAAPQLVDIAPAAVVDVPVAYLVCTPFGSLILVLSHGTDGPAVDALHVDDLAEPDLRRALGLGRDDRDRPPGYLLGQLGLEPPMKPYVQRLLAALGARLIRPLADWLARRDATGVTLIPAGHLGLLPLHAVSVSGTPAGRCLLDDFDVAYAPSAGALRSAREAAADRERAHRRLAGVADTTMDSHLRWARAELAEAARHFAECDVHSGAAATKAALVQAAESASYVHLACHGRYDAAAPLSSGLILADGMLTIGDVMRDRPFAHARLVVASACQTAIAEYMRLPDEVSGLPTGLLAAGTPAVIGTLWPTDDLSAALLMARFYRLHLREALPPAAALRAAQLWLRALTGEQLVAEVTSMSPTLTAFGVSDVLKIAAARPTTRFYDHPAYWAPYVLIGV